MSADRDTYTDASRDGSDQLQLKDTGYVLSFEPITLEQEKEAEGYQPGDVPLGAKKARPMDVSGTRGSSDVGRP